MIATQCSSWSRARHGPLGSSWGPLRDNKHVFGLPGLSVQDQEKVALGNKQMRASADIIRICNRFSIPCILENPIASLIFRAFPLSRLLEAPSCTSVTVDQCGYSARWRKRTRFACWNCTDAESLGILCRGRNGICSHTHKHHIILTGKSPSGPLWTSLAQQYPSKLSYALSDLLIRSYQSRKHNHYLYYAAG